MFCYKKVNLNINNNNHTFEQNQDYSLKINLALFGKNMIFWSRRGTLLTSSEPKKGQKGFEFLHAMLLVAIMKIVRPRKKAKYVNHFPERTL